MIVEERGVGSGAQIEGFHFRWDVGGSHTGEKAKRSLWMKMVAGG